MSDVQKEPLTSKRLQEVWEFCNLKNKSSLIDRLTKCLFIEIKKRTDKNASSDESSLSPEEVGRMCRKFCNEIVKRSIPPQKPLLESIPSNVAVGHASWLYNPLTSIVFRPKNTTVSPQSKDNDPVNWVATRVLKGGRFYPLKLTHLNVCVTNGWFFETDIASISSPFRVVEAPK